MIERLRAQLSYNAYYAQQLADSESSSCTSDEMFDDGGDASAFATIGGVGGVSGGGGVNGPYIEHTPRQVLLYLPSNSNQWIRVA